MAEPDDVFDFWDAEESGTGAEVEAGLSLVAVRVGGQEYCLPAMEVLEVLRGAAATPLPRMPDFLAGILDLRGEVLPVVDLSVRFGVASPEAARRPAVIVAVGGRSLGLLVDRVEGIREVQHSGVRPLPPDLPVAGRRFLSGVFPEGDEGRLAVVLDVGRLLDLEEQEAIEAFQGGA